MENSDRESDWTRAHWWSSIRCFQTSDEAANEVQESHRKRSRESRRRRAKKLWKPLSSFPALVLCLFPIEEMLRLVAWWLLGNWALFYCFFSLLRNFLTRTLTYVIQNKIFFSDKFYFISIKTQKSSWVVGMEASVFFK